MNACASSHHFALWAVVVASAALHCAAVRTHGRPTDCVTVCWRLSPSKAAAAASGGPHRRCAMWTATVSVIAGHTPAAAVSIPPVCGAAAAASAHGRSGHGRPPLCCAVLAVHPAKAAWTRWPVWLGITGSAAPGGRLSSSISLSSFAVSRALQLGVRDCQRARIALDRALCAGADEWLPAQAPSPATGRRKRRRTWRERRWRRRGAADTLQGRVPADELPLPVSMHRHTGFVALHCLCSAHWRSPPYPCARARMQGLACDSAAVAGSAPTVALLPAHNEENRQPPRPPHVSCGPQRTVVVPPPTLHSALLTESLWTPCVCSAIPPSRPLCAGDAIPCSSPLHLRRPMTTRWSDQRDRSRRPPPPPLPRRRRRLQCPLP